MKASPVATAPAADPLGAESGFVRGLGLFDSTMIVVGSMIGSGIFIVSADIARQTGSAGGLLTAWIVAGVLTVSAALSYGELAAMMPKAGGQYVYLRECYSPLWGFLYGWTLFLVIQTGTIAAVAVAFARFLGVLFPAVSPTSWIIPPVSVSASYAFSLSWQQFFAILLIVFLTLANTRGLNWGKYIQNIFTSAKTLALIGLVILGIVFGRNAAAIQANFSHLWAVQGGQVIEPGAGFLRRWLPSVSVSSGLWGLLVAYGVAQVGSLFSADAWNNITFTAGEVKNPRRDVPISLALRHRDRDHAVLPGQYRLSEHASPVANPDRSRRSRRHGRAQRYLRRRRRGHHGHRHYDFDFWLRQWTDLGWRARLLRHGARRPVLSLHRPVE